MTTNNAINNRSGTLTVPGLTTLASETISGSSFFECNTMQGIGNKQKPLPANTLTTVATFTGGPGVLKRVWLALNNVNPGSCAFRITFDGAATPQFGSNVTVGFTSANALACDVVFSAGFGAASYWSNEQSGCNNLSGTTLGGYIAFDMPFSSSFTIQIYNNTGSNGTYWCQAIYELTNLSVPYRFFAKPYQYTNIPLTVTPTVTLTECPLLSVQSPNGVILTTVKNLTASGGLGGWVEGKFRGYIGGTGMPGAQTYTPGPGQTELSFYNQQPGVTEIFQSSGAEDFFLNSYSFSGLTTYNSPASGVVLNSAGGPTGNITAYRNFFSRFDSCMGAPPLTNFVFTWTDGDQANLPGGSQNLPFILGYVGYYA